MKTILIVGAQELLLGNWRDPSRAIARENRLTRLLGDFTRGGKQETCIPLHLSEVIERAGVGVTLPSPPSAARSKDQTRASVGKDGSGLGRSARCLSLYATPLLLKDVVGI